MVCQVYRHPDSQPAIDLKRARWVLSTLGLLIDVVGERSILSLILRQARSEIESLVESEGNEGSLAA